MDASRRELLDRLQWGAVLLPALFSAPKSLLGSLLFDPEGPQVAPKPIPPNPFVSQGKALVAIVHGTDAAAMLNAGLELLGGLNRLSLAGKRVLLKPNIVNDRPPPTTTSVPVVEAVIRAMKEAGAGEVLVADSSGIIRFPTSDNMTVTGMRAAAERAGAKVLALEDHPWVRLEPPQASSLRHYYLSQPVYEADIFINLPVIKTHRFAEYSCSLKNLVGVTHPRYRPSVRFLSGEWHERIAELNLGVHPHLTIADGTTIMVAGGPTSGTAARGDLLVLSGDRVALDVVAMAIIRSFKQWPKLEGGRVWDQRQVKRAIELGLGVSAPGEIELVTATSVGGSESFDRLVESIRQDVGLR